MSKIELFFLAATIISTLIFWASTSFKLDKMSIDIDSLEKHAEHDRNFFSKRIQEILKTIRTESYNSKKNADFNLGLIERLRHDISILSFKIREIRETPGNEVIKTDRLIMEEFKDVKWTQHGIGLKPGYYIVAIPDYPAILSDDKDKFCFIISSFYDGNKFDHPEVTHFLIGLKPPKEYSEKNFIEKYKESMKVK